MKMLSKCLALAMALALPCLAHAGEHVTKPWEKPKAPEDREILKAAYEGDLSKVEAYLAKGGQADLSNREGMTMLAMAAEQNRIEVMQALIKAGADVNATNAYGLQTPLIFAAGQNHIAAMKLLIEAGADVNHKNHSGWTPLMWNCRNDQSTEEGFNLLLKAGADINVRADGKDSVLHFCARGRHQQIKQLIASKMDVNQRDFQGKTALHYVLSQGANIHIRESRQKQESLIETVQALLKAGADVNAKGKWGGTPLMELANSPLTELADIIIKAGAEVNVADTLYGRTALLFALWDNNPVMALTLLKAGADPKVKDKEGHTALMFAGRKALAEIVQALLKAGVDVNLADEKGKTALMWAASADESPWPSSIEFKKKQAETVKMLISAGADVNASDSAGKTALDLANTNEVKQILREAAKKGEKK